MLKSAVLTITPQTQRRFILGQQGLYPGRRWHGSTGVVEAIQAGSVVQVDPLNVVARSHDIALYGRVQGYRAAWLDAALHTDRALFDWGGTVVIHPMTELPYWRVVMARKRLEPRWVAFASEYPAVIDSVLAEIRQRGPLSSRDFESKQRRPGNFRSGKVTGQALYYLWLVGELMTHSRKGVERRYDLRERIAPTAFNTLATTDAAEDYFALKVFKTLGIVTARSFRSGWAGTIERKVTPAEAQARLEALIDAGIVASIRLEHDPNMPRYILADDLPLLETLEAGGIPATWVSVDTTTKEEMTLLAPLEIVSTRGRALSLFDFEYLWEVYKPVEKRRWGYYTLPVLYQDRLVARLDPKLERATGQLLIQGFWLEDHVQVDEQFMAALAAGLRRFMQFVGAETITDLTGFENLSGLLESV